MSPPPVQLFLAGALCAGYLVAAAIFLRFWLKSRDGLFLSFAAAFALMALSQSLPTVLGIPKEDQSPFYLLRLSAFVLIIVAVARKNLRR